MVLVEWQCPRKDHSEIEVLKEMSSVVLVDPPPEGEIWCCWRCGTVLERLREVPHQHPYAGINPIIPDAPVVKDADGKQNLF